MSNEPTRGNGKICYVEIPAVDIQQSAAFYGKTFEWNIRQDDQGNAAFDDGVGQVSGMWVTDRPPAREPGFIISIMVDDIRACVDAIVANGGKIVQPIGMQPPELTAHFSDPAGNVLGLYQERD